MDSHNEVVVSGDTERQFCERALLATSLPIKDAELIADTLVEADLRGVHSHGIQIIPRYLRGLKNGINPKPKVRTLVDTGALAVLDGDCGMGQLVSVKAMEMAIDKARLQGIAAVAVQNSNHLGALAYYGMMAAKENMIGFCTTNAPAIMAPWGGLTETLGNNPICYTIPTGTGYPIVLDMAVSTAARNKVRMAAAKGEKIPLDWGLDREGQPTDDPHKALDGLLAPMSGVKGFGLAVIAEVLTAGLSGGLIGKDIPRDAIISPDILYPVKVSHYFQAIDVKQLVPLEDFKSRTENLIQQVHESELGKNSRGVFVPGELEFQNREHRLKGGIPISSAVLNSLDKIAEEICIEKLTR